LGDVASGLNQKLFAGSQSLPHARETGFAAKAVRRPDLLYAYLPWQCKSFSRPGAAILRQRTVFPSLQDLPRTISPSLLR